MVEHRDHRRLLARPVRQRRRRHLGGPTHRRVRTPSGDDLGLAARDSRHRHDRARAEPRGVLRRLARHRRRDGRDALSLGVRRAHPLGRQPAGPGPDDVDPGRRTGQHRLRAARFRARRLARLAGRLPGAAGRARRDHGAAALVGTAPPLAPRPPRHRSVSRGRSPAPGPRPSRAARRSCCSPPPMRWPR